MAEEIINKVAGSGLVTIDLEELYPEGKRVLLDIKPMLFRELILKEKEFREFIKQEDWSIYKDQLVAIVCSSDAIVPTWAYMLLALCLEPFAKKIVFGDLNALENAVFDDALNAMDFSAYKNARVVIKGCSHKPVPVNAFVKLTAGLKPFAKSIMYGEPCSTVPLYKAPK